MHAKAAKKSAWDLRKLEELESSPKLPDVQRAEILNRVGDLLWEMGRANEVGYRPTKMGLDPYPALEPAFKAYVKIESLGQFAARDMEWKLRAGQLLVASGLATADAARTEKGVAVLKSIVVNYPDSPHSAYALVQICEALAANPSTGQKCYQRVAGGGDAYALAQYRLAELAADPAAKSKHLKLAKAQAKDKELRAAIELALNP